MTQVRESPILEIRDLVKHFAMRRSLLRRSRDKVRAVDGVSLQIQSGMTTALVGESGCGKSTIARLILQLLQPDSGEIRMSGEVVVDASKGFRRSVQMVFQDPFSSLTPHLTIRSILKEPLTVHKVCPAEEIQDHILDLVSAVGLSADMLNRYPHQLSGGQRQRIGIARAIAVNPKLIVCDEPVSALDVSIRSQIINLLLDIQKSRNLAYLFISHDLDMVAHVSDTVAVMYLGKIVEQAPTETFFAGPRHPYSKALLASALIPDPKRRSENRELVGEMDSGVERETGCSFRTRCPLAIDLCATREPALHYSADEHLTACHRIEPV